jgi:hypothetical protein
MLAVFLLYCIIGVFLAFLELTFDVLLVERIDCFFMARLEDGFPLAEWDPETFFFALLLDLV